jgi:hypothetical protein
MAVGGGPPCTALSRVRGTGALAGHSSTSSSSSMENVQKEIAGARESGTTTGRERAARHLYMGAPAQAHPRGSQRGRAVVGTKSSRWHAVGVRVGGESFAEWGDGTVLTLQGPGGMSLMPPVAGAFEAAC